jgi:hypothetical protein
VGIKTKNGLTHILQFTMSYSLQQQLGLAIVPKVSGTISILSSHFVMSEIFNDYRKNDMNPIKRALLGVTFFEICGSFGWFLSGWALPKDIDFALASGTWASCNFQGFCIQLIIGAPLFNGVLQYVFYLIVTGKCDLKQVVSVEKKAYAIITTYTFVSAIIPLALRQYNPMSQLCWISGYPSGCNEAAFGGSDYPCEHGNNAHWTGVILFYFVLWSTMLTTIGLNILVVRHLMNNNNHNETRWAATQCILTYMDTINYC